MTLPSAFVAALVLAGTAGAAGSALDHGLIRHGSHTAPTWSAPLTVTRGGTYAGSWESKSASIAAIRIETTEPVVITGRVRNLAGGTLIDAEPGRAVQVVLNRVLAYGGPSYSTSGRFFQAYDFKSVVVRNSTIENTRGIELTYGVSGSSVLITRNRHHNIQGNGGWSPIGNFVQFREVQNAAIEVSWNEIVNEYGKSHPEDIISLYHTSNAYVHDNMLWHQSTPGNPYNQSSQGGITLDASTPGSGCNRNVVARNHVVDGMGIVAFVSHGGNDNVLLDNRVVNDGRLPGGVRIGNGWLGMRVLPGGSGNHAHGNLIGYVSRSGVRNDAVLDGTPEGDLGEWANNRRMRGRITHATELKEWRIWKKKLAAKGIRVGA